jgi:hypothetical protein
MGKLLPSLTLQDTERAFREALAENDPERFAPRRIGPGCPCCGSEYRRRGCIWDFGCSCAGCDRCPTFAPSPWCTCIRIQDTDPHGERCPTRSTTRCVWHCGHPEHHPMTRESQKPSAPSIQSEPKKASTPSGQSDPPPRRIRL